MSPKKRVVTQSEPKSKSNPSSYSFVGEIKDEFKKVTWTEKDELQVYTKIVVSATFIFGMLIYLVDLLIQGSLSGLSSLIRLLAG